MPAHSPCIPAANDDQVRNCNFTLGSLIGVEPGNWRDALAVELICPSAVFTPLAEVQPDLSGQSVSGFGLYIIEQSVDSIEYSSPMPGFASIRLVKHASTALA